MVPFRLSFAHLLPVLSVMAAFAAAPTTALGFSATCNPRAYGAKGDGIANDTAAIQKAIDVCEQKGGGTVRLIAGTYLSKPIVLKSNITLQLDKDSTLLGSENHDDYPPKTEFRKAGRQSLVSAINATHVSIKGEGVIDGSGKAWWQEKGAPPNGPRPKLVVFDHCKHVLLEGITIQNSPNWHLVPYYSDDVIIRNIKILAPEHSPNTDAIDPFASSNVVIDHVLTDVGDDDVAIKSGSPKSPGPDDPSRNITITDCTFLHGHGLSVGSEISGGVQHLRVERIHFKDTNTGIRIKSGRDRGNDIGDFIYRDLTMENVKTPIQITDYYGDLTRKGAAAVSPAEVTRLTPHMHDVTIENLKATGSTGAAMDIEGLPEAPIVKLLLKNVQIESATGAKIFYADVVSEGLVIKPQSGPAVIPGEGVTGSLK